MKRSEMVEQIRKVLAMNGKDNGEGELEEALLHTIEVLGMSPPSIKEPCESYVLHNGKHLRVEDSFIFTHKWDE